MRTEHGVRTVHGVGTRPRVAFICVHNSCRSQIAEAFARLRLADVCDAYSAGVAASGSLNQDAVRLMKQLYGIDLTGQKSKTIEEIPNPDIVISLGCMDGCPYIGRGYDEDWGIPDPTGTDDETFARTIRVIEGKVAALGARLRQHKAHRK